MKIASGYWEEKQNVADDKQKRHVRELWEVAQAPAICSFCLPGNRPHAPWQYSETRHRMIIILLSPLNAAISDNKLHECSYGYLRNKVSVKLSLARTYFIFWQLTVLSDPTEYLLLLMIS